MNEKEEDTMEADTIAAVATAPGSAGISIIRVSGSKAVDIVDSVFRTKDKKSILSTMKTHTVRYGYIYDKDTMIDEVLVLYMAAPHSYTKENVVEIDCHGGTLVTRKILEIILSHGAILAEPGEFTKRAFLNGRIDLSQAEAVMDLIYAKNEAAHKNSFRQLRGALLEQIRSLRDMILKDTAYIEATLDDPEHMSFEGFADRLLEHIKTELAKINELISTAEDGRKMKEGVRTVILGKPNVGKSSLLNLLAKEERAIVTEIAGTTRDTIEEEILLDGVTLVLMDTAGIRDTVDKVEQIGVERARKAAKEADLILVMLDSSIPLDENDIQILTMLKEGSMPPVIFLLNKTDLAQAVRKEEIFKWLGKEFFAPIISFSVREQIGVKELEQTIEQLYFHGGVSSEEAIYLTNVRQITALKEAKESLSNVLESIQAGMSEDFYSIDLVDAYQALGKITGESMNEDLINTIFREFCMGK